MKVVNAKDEIEPRKVKVGINTNVSAQIIEGLKEGEKVVVAEVSADQRAARSQNRNSGNPLMGGGGGRRGMGGGGPRP